MDALLQLHTCIGEQDDLLLPARTTSSFTTVAGQGWLAGPKPSLDALIQVASWRWLIKQVAAANTALLAASLRTEF
jgi:hypothetical protein